MYTYGYDPRAYGATGGGVVNDAAAFTSANTAAAGDMILVSPGTYLISSSITITCPIFFAAGAQLILSGSATATFSYAPQAGRYQIFGGTALTSAAVLMAVAATGLEALYPEWWGAQPNNGSFDNGAAFNYCGKALTNVQAGVISLAAGNYNFTSAVSWLGLPPLTIYGQGWYVTTLSFPNGFTGNGVSIGGLSNASPAYDLTLRDLQIYQGFGTGPIGPTTGNSALVVQYAIRVRLENVIAQNWAGGIYYKSTTNALNINVQSFTSYAQIAAYGFFLDGTVSQNASIYFDTCITSHGAPLSSISTYGFYAVCGSAGDLSDIICTNCEFDNSSYGVYLNGTSGTDTFGSIDILFSSVRCDQNSLYGFYFNNLYGDASVKLTDCYWASASGKDNTIGVYIVNSSGIKITNLEAFAPTSATSIVAVHGVNSPSCQVHGLIIRGYFVYGILTDNGGSGSGCPSWTVTNADLRTDVTVSGSVGIQCTTSPHWNILGNHIYSSGSATWTNGITIAASSDYYNLVGNDIPAGAVSSNRYLINAGNTNGYQAGTQLLGKLPTMQTFLSGSGTYTTPANAAWIRVRAVGAGGGGGGGGAAGGTGGNGGNTTFGSSLISAGGGTGGIDNVANGGAGGSASLGSGPIGIAIPGGMGGASVSGTTSYAFGGMGGSSALGGAGSNAGSTNVGAAGAGGTNTGGGGGGGSAITSNLFGGCGGGAGGFVDAIIASPSSTYAYAVGAAGGAGTAGTNGYAGGAGGSGGIWVEEHYNF